MARRRSEIAAAEAFDRTEPTRTRSCEDPSYSETLRSANQLAYAEDAKQFRK